MSRILVLTAIATPCAWPYHLPMLLGARRIIFFLVALALAPDTRPYSWRAAPQNRPAAQAPALVSLQARFTPGQVMRYRIALESTSATRQSGLVQDPQGPAQLTVTWDATVRLEVFAAESGAGRPLSPAGSRAAGAGPIRLHITYEQSAATVRSDTPEPRSEEIKQQYAQLAGRSVEFTIAADGRVSGVHGLDGLLSDENARAAVQQWIVQLSAGAATPPGGVIPGQKWSSTQPADLPLAGLSWRTDASYLRNEPCRTANPQNATAISDRQDCAVILARLALLTTRSLRDPTPDEYRRNGLRTSGRWTGSGESLMYVSLDTGWVVSSTQESTQQMDVTISGSPAGRGSTVRQSGAVTTRSQVFLLNDVPAPAPSPVPLAR
ncbi:MAG TPA: hypothetical protein VIG89_07770 [Candidatus Acidoferrales bacterium]